MTKSKQRSEQHLIDAAGEQLLRVCLPPHWVLRTYRPDYGLDFSVEVFQKSTNSPGKPATYETLGEHLFIQLKSTESVRRGPLKLLGRGNVEKARERLNKDDPVGQMNTVRIAIESSELKTVERMGTAIPVLLVIADLAAQKCYFVCLNDYIDKILIPRHDDYTAVAHRTIHVPVINDISDPDVGLVALRWYAKRAKLYAAFQRFTYQAVELQYARMQPDFIPIASYFASRIANYDFWEDTEMWELISYYGSKVQHFVETGQPDLIKHDAEAILRMAGGRLDELQQIRDQLKLDEILELWRLLSVLPRNYEDVCREWFLPTALGYAASYPNGKA
jgi:hypothetical protein